MVDEIKVTEKDLQALRDVVESKKITAKELMEKEIREKILAEEKLKQSEENTQKLFAEIEALKKANDERERLLKEEFTKQVADLKNTRQSITTNINPFDDKKPSDNVNFQDPKVLDMIEERSKEEFLKKYKNLPSDWGTN